MKNLFDCKDEKITEKVFSQSLAVSVLSILLCLAALCSMTYAWFTTETTSGQNTLKSGCFDFTVEVEMENKETTIEVTPSGNGVYTCTIPKDDTCTVTLTVTDESNTKGYCAVTVVDTEKDTVTKRTAQIIKQDLLDDTASSYTFKLNNNTDDTVSVTFEVRWGIAAEPNLSFDTTYSLKEWMTTEENASSDQNP